MKKLVAVLSVFFVTSIISTETIFAMGRKPAAPPPEVKKAPPAKAAEPGAPAPAATPDGKQPKIVFEEKEYDFGKIMGADKVEHVFKFRNEGKADLKIDKVNTTCGCTAALLSANMVPAGGNGEVKATFTVGSRQGQQTKHIYVLSNDPITSRMTLTIKGFIVPPVDVDPSSVFLQPKDTVCMKAVKISQTMDEELKLGDITSRLNLVNTQVKELPSEGGKKRYSLEISLKPDIEAGKYFENVTVTTNCAAKPKIDIPVRITAKGDIEAVPSRVNLGSLETNKEVSRPITVSNIKGQSFKVERVEVENKDFSVKPEASTTSATSHKFTLTVKPSAQSGGVRTKIIFHLDHPKQKKVEATAYGYIQKEKPAPKSTGGEGDKPAQGEKAQAEGGKNKPAGEAKAQAEGGEAKPAQETKPQAEGGKDKPAQEIKAQPEAGKDKPAQETKAHPEAGKDKPAPEAKAQAESGEEQPVPPPPPAKP